MAKKRRSRKDMSVWEVVVDICDEYADGAGRYELLNELEKYDGKRRVDISQYLKRLMEDGVLSRKKRPMPENPSRKVWVYYATAKGKKIIRENASAIKEK